MAEAGESLLAAAAPEVGIPLAVGQQAVAHGKPLFGGLLVVTALLFIIISIIIIAAAKTSGAKTAGWMFFGLSLLMGGFGGYLVARERKDAPSVVA